MTSPTSIAIIGMAGRFPGADSLAQFWDNLRNGQETIERFSVQELIDAGVPASVARDPNYVPAKGILSDIAGFDASFFGFSPREASHIDPQQRIFLECAWQALEHAGYDPLTAKALIGLYAGCGDSTYLYHLLQSSEHLAEAAKQPSLFFGNFRDFFATRVAYRLNLKGPSINIQTACSTSLVAVHSACSALLAYQCDIALAGGIHVSVPHKGGNLHETGGVVSPDGHCRAFDEQAAGTVQSDGVGIVVLKRLEDALNDGDTIHAVILGSAVNNDGAEKIGYTAPSVRGQTEVITLAQEMAGIEPDDISYVEAHGTGTKLGDPIEIQALTESFRRSTSATGFCAIGSLKTNIGHLDAAAGVAGLIKTVLALKHEEIPASLHFNKPNPAIAFEQTPFYVNDRLRPWTSDRDERIAAVSSFGIGGTNAHVIVAQAPSQPATASRHQNHLLLLSAKTETALSASQQRLREHLIKHPQAELADVAFTLQNGRHPFSHRLSFVVSDRDDAITKLARAQSATPIPKAQQQVAFLFPGQGLQCVGMGQALYEREPVFRDIFDRGAAIAAPHLDSVDLTSLLFGTQDANQAQVLTQTQYAQPALFLVQYALARYLESIDIQPDVMLGHSIGEWVAACLADVFDFDDAIELVCHRARLMQACAPGAMLGVELTQSELLAQLEPDLEISVYNAPQWLIVSGLAPALAQLRTKLQSQGVACHELRVSHAFHSAAMQPAADKLADCFNGVTLAPPRRPFISNVTGTWITDEQACSPAYWAQQLRAPVRFDLGVATLQTQPDMVWIEVGPGSALRLFSGLCGQTGVVSTWPQPQQDAHGQTLAAMGQIWQAGLTPNFQGLYSSERRWRVPLPTYPFEHQPYWVQSQPRARETAIPRLPVESSQADAPKKDMDMANWFFVPHWRLANPMPMSPATNSGKAEINTLWILAQDSPLEPSCFSSAPKTKVVRSADGFKQLSENEFELTLTSREDYSALFEALGGLNWQPSRIIHASNVPACGHEPADPDRALQRYLELLGLAQAINKHMHQHDIEVVVLSTELFAVKPDDIIQPDKATLLGPAKVMALEYSNLSCRVIDLDAAAIAESEPLDWQIEHGQADRVVALRGKERYLESFTRERLTALGCDTRLRPQAHYLITGGLGGVGMALAEHLVRQAQAKITLVNRTPFPAREHWQALLADQALPALADQTDALTESIAKYAAQHSIPNLDDYPGLVQALTELAQSCVERYFATALGAGQTIGIQALKQTLKIAPRFERMFDFMLKLVAQSRNSSLSNGQLKLHAPAIVQTEKLCSDYPDFAGLIRFIDECSQAYPQALSGEVASIQVLYPEGRTDRLDQMQRDTVEYSQQRIYSDTLCDFVQDLSQQRCLRVLEVGGGQGILTRRLAPGLVANGASYHFTDISAFFIERAKTNLSDLQGLSTSVFDISRDPVAQGLAPGSFDIIVGLDVVHATPDIAQTVEHLRQLLAPRGYLALLETVRTGPWVDLCWGLADGWWVYQDQELRDSTLLQPAQWEQAFAKTDFEQSLILPVKDEMRRRSDTCLILAQAPDHQSQIDLPKWQAYASQEPAVINRYKIAQLLELERLGGQVNVISADISKATDVDALVRQATDRFGPIEGVIHAAMVLEDKLMQLKDAESARRVFEPKVHGSILLQNALKTQPLEFFVHCSSLAAPLGLYAQSDYCAATAFQDALAHASTAHGHRTMNWGIWRDAGFAMRMKLAEQARQLQWQTRPGPLLKRYVETSTHQWIFEGALHDQWPIAEHQLDGLHTLPGTGYLSLVHEAAGALGIDAFTLDSLVFSTPLTQPPGQPRPIRLRLIPSDIGYQFTIAGQQADRWIEHARGELHVNQGQRRSHSSDRLAALQQQFEPKAQQTPPKGSEPNTQYERRVGIAGRWQGISVMGDRRANEALAVLTLDQQFEDDLRLYPLHPALLDIATSYALGDQSFYLPLAYEQCRIHHRLSPRIWVHLRWQKNAESDACTLSFEVQIFNDDGGCALEIDHYTLRKVTQGPQSLEFRRLRCQTPGLLDSLTYVAEQTPRTPADDEVEICVAATGLNFRDVLSALGMLHLPGQGSGIGHECAGIVNRVGSNVHHLKKGDEVIAVAGDAYDDLVCVDQKAVRPKPASMSWEVAASIAVPFMTAHYALHHRANLRAGQTVLIHAAAGGVGLAAIQLARNTGAIIYASAGSHAKREYLRSLGVQHVFDSRSDTFATEIRRINPGGVDVVLNSLGGDLMLASLALLAPHGRFLELGKRDFAENRQLGMEVLGNGVSYFAINLSPDLPEYPIVFDQVLEMLAQGRIEPLPTRSYPLEQTAQAFADMAAAKHIGKLVVTRSPATIRTPNDVHFPEVDAPLEDTQLREGMSCAEGALAFERALSSGHKQVLVTPQDFLALLQRNIPTIVRQEKVQLNALTVDEPVVLKPQTPAGAQGEIAEVVRQSWMKHLGLSRIEPEDNFFALGGDSLVGIQIMAYLRKELGIDVPIAIFFESPTLQELTEALQALSGSVPPSPTATPEFAVDPDGRYDPFPLTDVQQAYWIGRSTSFELGNVSAHGYFEVDRDQFDYERFCAVWMQLVMRHDMLRMIVTADGQQRVLSEVPQYRPEVMAIREFEPAQVEASIRKTRHEMATQVLPSDQWPLFDIRISLLPGGVTRIHMSFDALVMDAWSSMILGREFALLYQDLDHRLPPLNIQFRDYVLHEQAVEQTEAFEKAKKYWLDRLQTLPPAPQLPLAVKPETLDKPSFSRREARLSAPQWRRLKQLTQKAGLTASAVCLTCFGDVLARWSQNSHFSVNLTLFNRPAVHPQVTDLVGDFTSLTLLEIDAGSSASFLQRAQRVQQQLARDIDHRQFSGVRVLRELVRAGQRDSGAIMPVVFTSTLALESQQEQHSPVIFDGKLVYGLSQTPQVWLDHGILEEHGELVLNWNAVDELFAPNMLDDMFEAYQTALTRLSDSTDWHHPFAIELPERQRAMRETFNQTTQDLAITRLEDPFFTQAAATPDAVAVATAQGDVTYRTVAQEALGICASLQRLGLKPQECVGVHLSKGWQQMAAIMGILRAGGAYVPLDPSLPTERLSSMASGMRWAISTDAQAQRLPSALRALCLHEIEPTAVDPGSSAELDALAYVIYTSGSTGKPKGVMIQHQAAMNTIADLVSRFGIGRQDRVLALSSLGFDLSVFDAFAMLGLGAKVVMPNEEGLREPDHWYQLLTDHQVTVWNSVPALMELLIDYVELNRLSLPCSLRLILLSGDWIATDLPARIARLLPNAEIISLGGATEASIWSIYYPIKQVSCDWQSIPYGYPLANQTYRVLNHDWVDCPEWVTGELYIGGAGVAAGYWQDEQQTAQRFVTIDGQRYYRTGDQGRFRPEGWIEFQGRNDHQVKIQGYRIEIAEIEAALRQHPNVTKSAVKVVTSASASRQLAAYVVSSDALAKPRATELSEFLQQRLPHYMIPATFTELDRLPLSSNSKIDYAALPEPKESASMAPAAQVPQTQTQQQVLAIIADVLGLAAVQPQQNLLDLGIDSIGMIRIANRIQAGLGIRPEIGQLYRMKTIHELIERCDQGQPRAEADARAATPAGLAPMITDPVERAAFKDRQTARRSFAKDHQSVALPGHNDTSTFEARKSQRHYSLAPLELESLSSWLSALRQIELNGQPKYLYASAGGLYPVQTYLFIKSGRVKGVSEGFYYYDPVDHRLVLISEAAVVHRQQFDRVVNQPIFDEAAFCVYFIASLSSIEPIYGEHSERFVNIEAGLMAQCLDLKAPELKIGVCHIGDVQVNEVLALLPEADKPQWLLCLLGGQTIEVDGADSQDAVSRLLNRVSQLTPEQVQDMLAAKRGQRQ